MGVLWQLGILMSEDMFDPGLEFVFRRHLCKDKNAAKTRTAYVPGLLAEKGVFASSEECGL